MAKPAENAVAPLPEVRDLAAGRVSLAGLGLIVLLAIALGGLGLIFGNQGGPAIGLARPDPAADLAAFSAHAQAELDGLGWVDRKAGIAHIPAADAMAVIAQRGTLPDWSFSTPLDQECALLEANVPRAAAAASCRSGWQLFMAPR